MIYKAEHHFVEFNKVSKQSRTLKKTINAKNIIIVNGARWRELSEFESDENLVWNYGTKFHRIVKIKKIK